MGDDIDRSESGEQDHAAEQAGRELTEMATGRPVPPPEAPPPGGWFWQGFGQKLRVEGWTPAKILVFLMMLLVVGTLIGLLLFLLSTGTSEEELFGGADRPDQAGQEAEGPAAGDEGGGEGVPAGDQTPGEEVTGDSRAVPPETLSGSFRTADGTASYEFRPDGTYTRATDLLKEEGAYRLVETGGILEIVWLDPDDPSGLYSFGRSQVVVDGDTVTFGTGEQAVTYYSGELIEPGVPGPFVITTPAVFSGWGAYRVEMSPDQHGCQGLGAQWVSSSVSGYEVDFVIDLAAGTITGTAQLSYDCANCRDDDEYRASALIAIESAALAQDGRVWNYQGTAMVDLELIAHREYPGVSCAVNWDHGGRFQVPFEGYVNPSANRGEFWFAIEQLSDGATQVDQQWEWAFIPRYHPG